MGASSVAPNASEGKKKRWFESEFFGCSSFSTQPEVTVRSFREKLDDYLHIATFKANEQMDPRIPEFKEPSQPIQKLRRRLNRLKTERSK